MKGVWKDEEVKALFDAVKQVKQQSKPIKEAFSEHAAKFSRQPNSVRNYYYNEVENLKKDKERLKRLDIDLHEHEKVERKHFSQQEKLEVIEKIKSMVQGGCSVRKACLELSGGDVATMLRYQNKYRSLQEQKPNNVLKFRGRPSSITDSDLQGLFMGLVRLVKKNAAEKMKKQMEKEREESRVLLAKLGQKERELNFLKEDAARLKSENLSLKRKLMMQNCVIAQKITSKKAKA